MKKGLHFNKQFSLLFLVCLIIPNLINAQVEVTPANTGIFTPESLISNVFLGDGVEVTNIDFAGEDIAVGYFTNGLGNVGIDRGILLTSGDATIAQGSNNTGGNGFGNDSGAICPQLNSIAPQGTDLYDVAAYTITFIPTADTLRFKYVFASEEYPEYACTSFNDVFGFFINGPNPDGGNYINQNVALIPDLADPTGQTFTNIPVTINNVNDQGVDVANGCPNDFGAYYNSNNNNPPMEYDGYLNVFIAQAIVIPCETYTMKLAVADAGDSAFDTGVFLEAKSFGTGTLEVEAATVSLDGTMTEGCSNGVLSFSLGEDVEQDFQVDYTIIGTAINGVDYEFIPADLTIIAGENEVTVPIIPISDGIDEMPESIGIDVQRDVCNRDTFWIFIRDNEIVDPVLREDTIICSSNSVQLDGTLQVTLPPPPIFTFEGDLPIGGYQLTESEIQVFGVQPVFLEEGVIKQVCIDSLIYNWDDDLALYLIAPSGQFLELTSDNGANGDNYIGTCFSPVATTLITDGGADPNSAPADAAPFTGDFLPEGDFADLWDGENLTNGIWKLIIRNKFNDPNAFLHKWSICFESIYQIEYTWSPVAGLDCWDCPNPNAAPDQTTTYVLTATDSYGCEVYDSVTISVLDQLPPPIIDCINITDNSITFNWADVSGASGGFEVSIDGGITWIPANNGPLSHIVSGLALSTDVDIEVRAIGMCDGEIATQQCTTPACIPPAITLDNTTATNCHGGTDGTIEVAGTGTYPPFTFTLDMQSNSTGVFTGLSAGTYEIFIEDGVSCGTSLTVDVAEPDTILTAAINIQAVSCFGEADAEISVGVSGGTYPYNFNWGPGQTDSIATGLVEGIYEVTITDGNGCIAAQEVEISQPQALTLSISADSLDCFGLTDGIAAPTFDGGTGPFDFAWSDGQVTSSAQDLSAGIYSLVLTDDNMCTITESITILEPTALASITSGMDVDCYDSLTGEVAVNITGGSGPYGYNWNGTQNTQTAIDLAAGMHYVTVTDANDCQLIDSMEIFQPNALEITLDSTDVLCNAGTTGAASATVIGGMGNYTFAWTPSGAATATANGLAAGMHTVLVTDENDCTISQTIEINEPAAYDISENIVDVNCNLESNGSIDISVSGGSNNFSFQWDNGAITEDVTGLAAGMYTVDITDDNNCTTSATYEVEEPTAISTNNTTASVNCYGGNDGAIDLQTTGGNGPYTYEWSNGETTEDLNNIISGAYVVTVTDSNMCTYEATINVDQPIEAVTTDIPTTETICFAASDGTATVNVTGGTGPYTFEWSDGQTTSTATGLSANAYQVTVTDAGDCTYEDEVVIAAQSEIIVMASAIGALCNNGNEGSASIDDILYGNMPANISDFVITWSNGQNGPNAVNLVGGNSYTVTVTDALNCMGSATVQIDNPASIGVLITEQSDVLCHGEQSGRATVTGSGGTLPYTYLWSPNASSQTTQTATNLATGNYIVTITDANNCTTTTTVEIQQPARLIVDLTSTDILCKGEPQGTANAFPDGGTPPYFYQWEDGTTTQINEDMFAGIYEVTIIDNNGCTVVNQIEIKEPEEYLGIAEDHSHLSCWDAGDGFIDIDPSGGTAPYMYSLDGINFNGADKIPGLDAGDYFVYVKDANGCIEEYSDTINIYQPFPLEVNCNQDETILFGETVDLSAEVSNQNGLLTYSWSPADSLTCSDCPNPTAIDLEFQTSFTLTVVDENGCIGKDVVTIFVRQDRFVFVPTGFSPNGDGINDQLSVVGHDGTRIITYSIFDRWGELVYQALDFDINDNAIGWDGSFRSKEAMSGIYLWSAEVEYEDGKKGLHNGQTTLIR